MPVKSLMDLATAACIKNIRELNSVGDYLPYENVRQILLKVDNAPQLRQIELNSPQVEGETGEIWLKLIEREFPMEYKAKAYKPQDPKKWYRVWEKYKKDHDKALEESEKKLKNALAGLKQTKIMGTSRITGGNLARRLLPRTPIKRGWGNTRDPNSGTLSFGQGSRTKTNTGASVMRKVRREVKEIANIHGSLSRHTQATSAITRPMAAPTAMINDRHRARQPIYRTMPQISQPLSAVEEYEERATFLSDSEDDYGKDERDDLWDDDQEDEAPPSRSSNQKSYAKSSATSLLKSRPTASATRSPVKSQASSSRDAPRATVKRSGILSNSYKGSAAKKQTTSAPTIKPSSSSEPYKSSRPPPRTQTSPPPVSYPVPSSPPPAAASGDVGPMDMQPRKRKAVSIFMSRKKRA